MAKSSSDNEIKTKKYKRGSSDSEEPIEGTSSNGINAEDYISHEFEYEVISGSLYIRLWPNQYSKYLKFIFLGGAYIALMVIFIQMGLGGFPLFIVASGIYIYIILYQINIVKVYKFYKHKNRVKCIGYNEGNENNPFYNSKSLIKCKLQECFDVNRKKGGGIDIHRGHGILIKDEDNFHVLGYLAQPKDSRLKKCFKKLKQYMDSIDSDDYNDDNSNV
eukprot:Mrub_10087.p1 GENE.Mrub_10087~~Mrub_10087.p1  ORF type:complete len:219 (-),score=7.73 Mrub_10087:49-705(-)